MRLHDDLDAMQPTLDRDAAEFNRVLSELVRVYQFRDRDRVGSHDVTGAGAHVLDVLVRLGPIGLNQLAAELFVDKSTASKLVTGLEEKKYLSRTIDPEDRRAVLLEVTGAGRELHERISGDRLRDVTALLRPFTDEHRQGMTTRLRQIIRTYAVYSGFTDASVCVLPANDDPVPFGANLRMAGRADLQEVLTLAEAAGLSVGTMEERLPGTLVIAREPESGELIGLAGLERYGAAGVLWAIAVRTAFRRGGLGKTLLLTVVNLARTLGMRELYLAATQAGDVLSRQGWEEVAREELPATLREVDELRTSAATTAVMRLRLS
jgi:MarR family transcriptional regulator, 2-MHQ and catechol-resistance regulon repressor